MKFFYKAVLALTILIIAAYVGMKLIVGAVNIPIGTASANSDILHSRIQLPAGFSFTVYAGDVPNARELRLTQAGDLLVANPSKDQIIVLKKDQNRDGTHDGKNFLLENLNAPNGMDFYQEGETNWLYIAEQDAIGRIKFNHERGETVGDYQRLIRGLPSGGNHWKKSLRVGPDNKLYVTFGSSCNVCIEDDQRRATIMRYALDGSEEEIFARGLRNSEGFDWSPIDGALYATDNGRDLLGDNFPPCELNKVEQGRHYGWPFANGGNIADPDYVNKTPKELNFFQPPSHEFNAHNAPLGMVFLRHQNPASYFQYTALVALHGSWNRSEKDGYKVVALKWQEDGSIQQKDFMSGFLKDDKVIGRPVDIAEDEDGSIYISDDYAGAIYRVTLKKNESTSE